MKIFTIKFIDGGRGGIHVEGEKMIEKDRETILADYTETRKQPVPFPLRAKLNRLKPYYLMLTGHWRNEWMELLEDGEIVSKNVKKNGYAGLVSLLDNTEIRGITTKGGFLITGFIKTLGVKGSAINTPNVVEDDEFEFHGQVCEEIDNIKNDVTNYFKSKILFTKEDAKQLLIEFYDGKQNEINRVSEQDDKQNEEEMLQNLSRKGYVIYEPVSEITSGDTQEAVLPATVPEDEEL